METIGIDHVVLRVHDLEKMARFYSRVLGCPVERRRDDLGMIHLRAGPSLIDLVAVDGKLGRAGGRAPGVEGRNMDHLCLRIADFDAQRIRRELEEAGVATGEQGVRHGASGSAVSLYLRDPEGNGLELRS